MSLSMLMNVMNNKTVSRGVNMEIELDESDLVTVLLLFYCE